MKTPCAYRTQAFLFLTSIIFTACAIKETLTVEPVMTTTPLPMAEDSCPSRPSWKGISPGLSTRSDAIRFLGEPDELGYLHNESREFFLYQPIVTTKFGDAFGNSVVFGQDQMVEWMDVWVSNLDGGFHSVNDFAKDYGFALDQVYIQKVADVYGPTQVYVWSHCGLALTAVAASKSDILPLVTAAQITTEQLTFKHPIHPAASLQPLPDGNDIVIRQFLFQPTSFEAFKRNYAIHIPYLRDKDVYQIK